MPDPNIFLWIVKTKSLFTLWKPGSIKKSKYWFEVFCVVVFVSYLFQLIVYLNLDFNCCNNFALSSIDKVTTGTKRFCISYCKFVAWFSAALDITQFAGQVRMRLISQLINGISRVLQKLLKYFNGTIISTFFVSSFPVEPVIFV